MKKSKRMQPLKELAEDREQQAARALGQSRQLLDACRERQRELREYREDYLQRFRADGSNGMTAHRLQSYQSFIGQLDAAIEQQQQQIADAEMQCQIMQQNWHQNHMKTRIMDKTVERFKTQEQQQHDKRSQREADDRVHVRLTPTDQ